MRNPISTDTINRGVSAILDPELSPDKAEPKSEVAAVLRVSAAALAVFFLLYVICLLLNASFPYLRPGDSLVADLKHSLARSGTPFHGNGHPRIMAFGYSKALAGFIPAVFDRQLAAAGFPGIQSYNFGLPGDSRFVDDLEAMAARGAAPDVALLTFPWPEAADPGPTVFHFINNDQNVMDRLFPFRYLLRDFTILTLEGHSFAGMKRVYQDSERSVNQVATDHGYYFIARQSHFANDQLPVHFSLPSDNPNALSPRPVTLGPIYQKLARILAERRIHCLFVPNYYREGEFAAPPPLNLGAAAVIAGQPNVAIAGPDYWLYPNRFFSDPVHANRQGADVYTRSLADLTANWLKRNRMVTQ